MGAQCMMFVLQATAPQADLKRDMTIAELLILHPVTAYKELSKYHRLSAFCALFAFLRICSINDQVWQLRWLSSEIVMSHSQS